MKKEGLWGYRSKQRILYRENLNGWKTLKRSSQHSSHQGNANKNYFEISPYTSQNGQHQKINNSTNLWECGARGTLLHCWWESKLVQLVWKSMWRFLRKVGIYLPQDPGNSSTLGHIPKVLYILLQRHLLNHVHCCSIHNNQKLETTQMSFIRRMDKENVVHQHNGVLLSCLKMTSWNL